MNNEHEKFVDFHAWCKKCKHHDIEEDDDPCFECLYQPVNFESTKPIKFAPKD